MKYVILIGDGMADRPIAELGGRTPLEVAQTPNLDALAGIGTLDLVRTLSPELPAGSDIANMTILGYDPHEVYTGRAPLEAANLGLELSAGEIAYRCNLVNLGAGTDGQEVMVDFSAGHIGTDEARELILELERRLGGNDLHFHVGASYRHIMIWSDIPGEEAPNRVSCTPPHDIMGQPIRNYLPADYGTNKLHRLMEAARGILENHPVNQRRKQAGKLPANGIWLWGAGDAPRLESFQQLHGLSGSMISAVDLLKGIGKLIGFRVVSVPGATGYLDTNYLGKAEYALRELEDQDLVYLHVEAPDEAGHNGDLSAKIQAIENFDHLVVGTIRKGMPRFGEYKIMALPDHSTPIELRTHSREPVPVAICSSREAGETVDKPERRFSEEEAKLSPHIWEQGWRLMDYFLAGI